ncbi:MAG: hypothetical protein WAV05_10110, partial [Anaerolineales bacterium]
MRRPYFILLGMMFILVITALLAPGRKTVQATAPVAPGSIYFDDSDPELLVLGNQIWEIAFRKTNGGIVTITDKTVGGEISLGSRNECLWGASDMQDLFYIGGCSFNKDWSNHFSYSWSAGEHALTLSYITDPGSQDEFIASVRVTASNTDYFDMQLNVQEHYQDGRLFDFILFPSDVYFREADVNGMLLPLLPGVILKPDFFTENRVYYWNYPGYPGAYADYLALSATSGELAMYS